MKILEEAFLYLALFSKCSGKIVMMTCSELKGIRVEGIERRRRRRGGRGLVQAGAGSIRMFPGSMRGGGSGKGSPGLHTDMAEQGK